MRRLRDRGGPEGTRYTMREKMFAIGDDYWIETDGGERAFKVNGKAMRIRDTLVIESRSGEELFKIQEKKLSVRDKMEIERGGQTVATVKKTLIGIRDRYSIEVEGGDDLSAKGNFVQHEYEIERDGDKVAEISKKWLRVRRRVRDRGRSRRGRRADPGHHRLHRPDGPRLTRATSSTWRARGCASPRRARPPSAGALARVAGEPARVAVGERGRGEAVGEDREPDGQIDRRA